MNKFFLLLFILFAGLTSLYAQDSSILWEGNYLMLNEYGNRLYCVAKNQDSTLMSCGYYDGNLEVLKSKKNGQNIFESHYKDYIPVGYSITAFKNGYITTGMTQYAASSDYDINVYRLDNLGYKTWNYIYTEAKEGKKVNPLSAPMIRIW